MIISSPKDYEKVAKNVLPPFLFEYIAGGAGNETTLRSNQRDLARVAFRQRILSEAGNVDLSTTLWNQKLSLPLVLAPVGLTGMYGRYGEVAAAHAAKKKNIPFTLSTVGVSPVAKLAKKVGPSHLWFQLYVLKDHAFMRDVLQRAWNSGVRTLVFTVDMPIPGARYRDRHSGLEGNYAWFHRAYQIATHWKWAISVGLLGGPHDLGNISTYMGKSVGLLDYMGYLNKNFDPSIGWKDLEWIRSFWKGKMILKGILDKKDAKEAVQFGADGIVVSNHGGRQLDGAISTARALPAIADEVKGQIKILADSGIRSGLDVMRMIALGADAAMIGRSYIYALASAGEAGVTNLLNIYEREMRICMTLTGQKSLKTLDRNCLAALS
ncbi:alpha-hydroxy-acid oxidizing protein [Acetobacteraceae bacterium]|nr:alpha-hydroxy-acid oxidizing protein [Acetobacteraceae bacterium]